MDKAESLESRMLSSRLNFTLNYRTAIYEKKSLKSVNKIPSPHFFWNLEIPPLLV
jgi:hypothetical protein